MNKEKSTTSKNMIKFTTNGKQFFHNPLLLHDWDQKLNTESVEADDNFDDEVQQNINQYSFMNGRSTRQQQQNQDKTPFKFSKQKQNQHQYHHEPITQQKVKVNQQLNFSREIQAPSNINQQIQPQSYHFGTTKKKVDRSKFKMLTQTSENNSKKMHTLQISQTSQQSRKFLIRPTTAQSTLKTETTFETLQLKNYFGNKNLILMQQLENFELNKLAKSGIFKLDKEKSNILFTQASEITIGQPELNITHKKTKSNNIFIQNTQPNATESIRSESISNNEQDISKVSSSRSVTQQIINKPLNLRDIIHSRFSQIMILAQQDENVPDKFQSPKFHAHERLQLFPNQVQQYSRTARSNSQEMGGSIGSIKKIDLIKGNSQLNKRDSATQIVRRIGVRIQQGDIISKAFSQVQIAFQSKTPEDLQILQTYYLEETEELECSQVPALTSIKLSHHSHSHHSHVPLTNNTKIWVPSFQISFIYKSVLSFWQVKLVSPPGNNQTEIFMFEQNNHQYVYKFQVSDLSRNQLVSKNQTMWPHITEILLKKIKDFGFQEITSVLEKRNNSFIKPSNQNKFSEQLNIKNLLQILTQNLVYQQKKVSGIELQFLPSKYIEVDSLLTYYEFMESTKLLYLKLNQYEQTIKRNFAILFNPNLEQKYQEKKEELIQSNCQLLQQIIQFRFHSQNNRQYLLQIETIKFEQLISDADFLGGIIDQYGRLAQIIISIKILRQVNLELDFADDNFEFVFQLLLLPKSFKLHTDPHKLKAHQQAFVTNALGRRSPSLQIAPICLRLGPILKIMEDQQNQFGLLNLNLSHLSINKIVFDLIKEKRQSLPFFYVLREFVNKKLSINFEKKELAVKINIFSVADALKLEAAGLALGFLVNQKTYQTPYAITEIERYILDDANKQGPSQIKNQYNFNPETLFQRNFQDISDQDYKQKRENIQVHRSLYDIVKKYQPKYHALQDTAITHGIVIKKNPKQVGNLDVYVYQDNPYDPTQAQEKNHSKITQIFIGGNKKTVLNNRLNIKNQNINVSIALGEVMIVKFYYPFQKKLSVCYLDQNDKQYDELQIKIKQYIQQGNSQILQKFAQQLIYKQVIQKMYIKYGGFDAFKILNENLLQHSIQEIPPYNMLKSYMLNQFDRLMSLFRYKNLLLVQKLKKYGIFQVNVHVFYSLSRELDQAYDNSSEQMEQERMYLTDGNHFLMRLDVQQFDKKIGKTKIILNHFDIEKYLGIQIFPQTVDFRMTQNLLKLVTEQNAKFFTDLTIQVVASKVLQLLVFGRFRLTLTPYFSEVQLLFLQNPQKFQPSQDEISGTSQSEIDSGERKRYLSINADSHQNEGQKITNQVAQLRRINNKNQDSDLLNKDLVNKNFLEQFIKNSRLILNQVKQVYSIYNKHSQGIVNLSLQIISPLDQDHQLVVEFAVFSVYKNLLSNSWFVIIYIPKTTRRLIAILSSQDISETTGNKLPVFQPIQFKDSIKEKTKISMSYDQLEKLCDRTKYSAMQNLRSTSFSLKAKNYPVKLQIIDDVKFIRGEKKKLTGREDDFKQKQGLNLNDMISEFFKLTDMVSNYLEFTVHTFIRGEEQSLKHLRYLEKKIWKNILNQLLGFKLNIHTDSEKKLGVPLSSELISLSLGTMTLPMSEYLCGHYMRIERIGEAYVEFFIKYDYNTKQISAPTSIAHSAQPSLSSGQETPKLISTPEQPRRLALVVEKMTAKQAPRLNQIIQEAKEADRVIRFVKKINVFQPFEAISYASSSNFNIELRYYSFNQLLENIQQVNLRELLNLYIADGYYKYQTTYMNSKLNLSDIHNICSYVIYKIKTQNYLNLTQYHIKEKSFQKKIIGRQISFSIQSIKSASSEEIPHVKTFFYKPKKSLITIKLYYHRSTVQFEFMNLESKLITRETISFEELDSVIMFFKIIAIEDYRLAMDRLQQGMKQIQTIFKPKIKIFS